MLPENDKKPELDIIKINNEEYNIFEKTNKEEINKEEIKKEEKEEPTIEFKNQNIPKIDKNEIIKDKDITPKTEMESGEKKLKIKKKIIKKGSQRVQQALLELKLLSMKELDNNKKYFSQN